MWTVFFSALPIIVLIFALTWIVQRFLLPHDDAGIVDVVWSPSLALTSIYYAVMLDGDPTRQLLLVGMACLWGFRLGWHVYSDRIVGKPEDSRYAQMREEWGERVQLWFFLFYQVQAFAAWILSIGFVVIMSDASTFSWTSPLTLLAIVIFALSVLGETVADNQLAAFRRDPANKGQVCRQGLWAYSRHPNYFFEWVIWISYIALGITAPLGWVTIVPALVILFFLTRMSGIPNNEAQNLRSKPDAYRQYQAEVSAFVPWFPKN